MSDEKGCQAPCRYGWDIAGTDWHHHNCPNAQPRHRQTERLMNKPTPAPPDQDGDEKRLRELFATLIEAACASNYNECVEDSNAFDRLMARLRDAERMVSWEKENLLARAEAAEAERDQLKKQCDYWMLRTGQNQAKSGQLMLGMAFFARDPENRKKAQQFVKRADEAMSNVRLEDCVVAQLNKAMQQGGESDENPSL